MEQILSRGLVEPKLLTIGCLQTIDDEKDVTAVEKIMEQELLVLYWKSRQRYVEGESAIPEEKMQKFIQDIQAKHGITYVSPEISKAITSNAKKRIEDMRQAQNAQKKRGNGVWPFVGSFIMHLQQNNRMAAIKSTWINHDELFRYHHRCHDHDRYF